MKNDVNKVCQKFSIDISLICLILSSLHESVIFSEWCSHCFICDWQTYIDFACYACVLSELVKQHLLRKI